MMVERPRNYKYIIQLQCFDEKGKLMWEERESKDGWSETGATNGVFDKIKKKLLIHIGSAGLPLKQDNPTGTTGDQHKNEDPLAASTGCPPSSLIDLADTHAQLAGNLWPRQAGGTQASYSSGIHNNSRPP